jgi:hypothetical protein
VSSIYFYQPGFNVVARKPCSGLPTFPGLSLFFFRTF